MGAENVKSGVLILVLFEGVVALMSYLIVRLIHSLQSRTKIGQNLTLHSLISVVM